jgi:hypothetical protein
MEQNSGQQARLDIGQLRFCAGCGHSGIDDFVSSTLQGCEYIGVAIRGASFVNHCDSHLDNPFSGLPIGQIVYQRHEIADLGYLPPYYNTALAPVISKIKQFAREVF